GPAGRRGRRRRRGGRGHRARSRGRRRRRLGGEGPGGGRHRARGAARRRGQRPRRARRRLTPRPPRANPGRRCGGTATGVVREDGAVEPTAELEALPGTRAALHRLAAHVLGRRRSDVTGRFGLRPAPGGLATPAFGDAGEVVRVCGTVLGGGRAGRLHAEPGTTLGRAAEAVGGGLAVPFAVGRDTPPVGDPGRRRVPADGERDREV